MTRDSEETRAFSSSGAPLRRLAEGSVLTRRYRLESRLGSGGMGVVYRAIDLELDRPVAVKLLPGAASSADARARLLREARAAASLNHPHIVAVHDAGEDDGVPFFVMELVAGPSLGHERRSSMVDIVEIGVQVCQALDHAHARSLVHRDLKPENILVDGSRASLVVKLADLGLAVSARASRKSEAGLVVGTAAYMAPEQAMGEAVDGRADLYSLGAVLYELATGRAPFQGDHPLGIISQHVNAPVVPPRVLRPDLPQALERVILRLLAKDPGKRFANAADTSLALRDSLISDTMDSSEPAGAVAILDALSRGRLVGRDAELRESIDLWRRARDGRSHGLLFSGEPGAGKTRLARELITQARLDSATVLSGACYEFEAATPYLPFAEAFRRWVRDEPDTAKLRAALGEAAPHLARLAPDIDARLGPFPERTAAPTPEERLLFFDAVADTFRNLAAAGSLLFYVDDLHWADGGTLSLVGHLLRTLRDARVLIVASYRETELDRAHPLAKALVEWNRERLTTRVVLRRLKLDETQAQLSVLLGESVGDAFAQALYRETEGNPFFVEEMLKALIEQGSVKRQSGRWRLCETSDLHLPQSMKAAIGRRLDRVSAGANDVLRAAAVLGKSFSFAELLAAAGDRAENALLDALDEAVAAQLLVPGRDDTFLFTHDKIREVLYEELNPVRRRRLHLRTADALAARCERKAVPVEKLAHHYIEAGDYEQGLRYAKDAGAEAVRLFAYEEALAAFSRALSCAEALERPAEQAELEDVLGGVCLTAGNQIAALAHFEAALRLTSDKTRRAHLLTEAATSLVVVGDQRGLDYLHEARGVLDPEQHPLEFAQSLTIEARFHHLAGRHHEAINRLLRAVEVVQAVRPAEPLAGTPGHAASTTLMQAYAYLAGAHQHLGLFADGNRWAHRNLELAREAGLPAAEALGYEFLAENAAMSGDWQVGLDNVAREREVVARLHSRERQAWTHLPAGTCAQGLGDLDRADSEFDAGIALADAIGERRLGVLLMAQRATVAAQMGRADAALALALDALERADAINLLFLRTEARRCLAEVYYRRREPDRAFGLWDEVIAMAEGLDAKVSRLTMAPLHIEALLSAGRFETAQQRLAEFEALAAECQSPRATSEVARLRGLSSLGSVRLPPPRNASADHRSLGGGG